MNQKKRNELRVETIMRRGCFKGSHESVQGMLCDAVLELLDDCDRMAEWFMWSARNQELLMERSLFVGLEWEFGCKIREMYKLAGEEE